MLTKKQAHERQRGLIELAKKQAQAKPKTKVAGALNYTPHSVVILREDGEAITMPSVGTARATAEEPNKIGAVLPWPAVHEGAEIEVIQPPRFKGVEWTGEGKPEKGAMVIVSIVAAPAVATARPDLTILVPDTGPGSVVRTASGQIKGVRRLILWHTRKASGERLPFGKGTALYLRGRWCRYCNGQGDEIAPGPLDTSCPTCLSDL